MKQTRHSQIQPTVCFLAISPGDLFKLSQIYDTSLSLPRNRSVKVDTDDILGIRCQLDVGAFRMFVLQQLSNDMGIGYGSHGCEAVVLRFAVLNRRPGFLDSAFRPLKLCTMRP